MKGQPKLKSDELFEELAEALSAGPLNEMVAQRFLREAKKIENVEYARSKQLMGNVYFAMANEEKCLQMFKAAMNAENASPHHRQNFANALIFFLDIEEGIDVMEDGLRSFPEFPSFPKALSHLSRGFLQFEKAATLDKGSVDLERKAREIGLSDAHGRLFAKKLAKLFKEEHAWLDGSTAYEDQEFGGSIVVEYSLVAEPEVVAKVESLAFLAGIEGEIPGFASGNISLFCHTSNRQTPRLDGV